MSNDNLPKLSSSAEVAEFLRKAAAAKTVKPVSGRLIFALDATASRQPTWDHACQLQGEMFVETAGLGGLAIQLVWYRGLGEFDAGPWVSQSAKLVRVMSGVFCQGGITQLARVLKHAIAETQKHKINALVFVGDCMEEDIEELAALAGELGLLGVPIFIFHEGGEPAAAAAFRRLARLSHGAYCRFDAGSAQQLRDLLGAVAVYAAGGNQALEEFGRRKGGLVLQLAHRLQKE
jgi:hypothetical protein